jgi:hypothetical protein
VSVFCMQNSSSPLLLWDGQDGRSDAEKESGKSCVTRDAYTRIQCQVVSFIGSLATATLKPGARDDGRSPNG